MNKTIKAIALSLTLSISIFSPLTASATTIDNISDKATITDITQDIAENTEAYLMDEDGNKIEAEITDIDVEKLDTSFRFAEDSAADAIAYIKEPASSKIWQFTLMVSPTILD